MESKKAIEEANAEFYRAIESEEIERLDEVWSHEDWVRCVHPGWEMISGWQRVRESWKRIFEGGQKMRISPSDVSIHASDDFAWVTCIENITIFFESSFDSTQAAATNLFVRRQDRWLLVHHHASPIPMILPESATDTIQ
ncbi:MAG TPA: nuclear transport factor 2 family protein [Blastocatellia bacterium]|nr:nuclear transport factor 2 family protein [Blastocatellia bacterium]